MQKEFRDETLPNASFITIEYVIPAKAGIQTPSLRKQGTRKRKIDSPVSSTGQACRARNDKAQKFMSSSIKKRIFQERRAFTLLEVMIALAILSLVAVAFLRTQAGNLHLLDESNQISTATLLAREKMAELETIGFPEPGKIAGSGGETFPQFRWEQIISPTEILSLRKALVRVLWMDGKQERALEFTAYFAKR
jgi:general secretion pathway protein I